MNDLSCYTVEVRSNDGKREYRLIGPLLQFCEWRSGDDAYAKLEDLASLLNRIAEHHYERGRKEMQR